MATDVSGTSGTNGSGEFRQLADYVDGCLDGPEHAVARAAVEHLLATSADARATEQWLRETIEVTRRVPLVDRSPLVEQRLRHYFTRWVQAQNVLTRPVPRFTATIVADSRVDRALAGVRGTADLSGAASLLYGCDVGELALDLRPAGAGTVRLDGQVLLDAPTESLYFGVSVVVAGTRETTESDELGRFCFRSLPAVPTTLRVDNGELEIAATLDLSPADAGPVTGP